MQKLLKQRWLWAGISLLVIILVVWKMKTGDAFRSGIVLEDSSLEADWDVSAAGESEREPLESSVRLIGVHITGAVANPDQVLYVPEGSRVKDIIDLAGGALPEADLSRINLAAYVSDGQKVTVPLAGQELPEEEMITGDGEQETSTKYLTNINSATKIELMELPGIGEAMAERIIAYRQEHGGFASIEELMNVSGIGETKFNGLKDLITCE